MPISKTSSPVAKPAPQAQPKAQPAKAPTSKPVGSPNRDTFTPSKELSRERGEGKSSLPNLSYLSPNPPTSAATSNANNTNANATSRSSGKAAATTAASGPAGTVASGSAGNATSSSSAAPSPSGGSSTNVDSTPNGSQADASKGGATADASTQGNGVAVAGAIAPNPNGTSAAGAAALKLGPTTAATSGTASVEGPTANANTSSKTTVNSDGSVTQNQETKVEATLVSGTAEGKVAANLPGGVKVEGSGNANGFVGYKGDSKSDIKVGPNGSVDATLGGSGIAGARVEGQGQVKVTGLPAGSSAEFAGSGFATAGARGQIAAFNNPATAPTPGQLSGPTDPAKVQIPANGTGVNINGGLSGFAGVEAQATVSGKINTPIGSLGNTTTLRASSGAGGDLGGQVTINKNEATVGLGGGFETGSSVGVATTNTVATPNGSSLSNTGIVSAGGLSGEARVGASRNNTTGNTSVGATVAVPIPGTTLTAGGGFNATVNDKDVRAIGNVVAPGIPGVAGGGDVAVKVLQEAPGAINAVRQAPNQITQAVTNIGVQNMVAGEKRGGLIGGVQQTVGFTQAVGGQLINDLIPSWFK